MSCRRRRGTCVTARDGFAGCDVERPGRRAGTDRNPWARGTYRDPTAVRRLRLLAVAATIFLLLGVGAYWIWRKPAAEVVITQASGDVSWTSGDSQRHGLETGNTFRSGTLSLEGAASSAELLLGDGSVLRLTGDSELMVPDRTGTRFLLRCGALSADVRPHPADCPMVIRTPVAEIEVLGTRFQISAQPGETVVAVETGRVRMMRLADETSVNVSEKQTAWVSLDVAKPIGVGVLPHAPKRWRQTFRTGTANHLAWRMGPCRRQRPGQIAKRAGFLPSSARWHTGCGLHRQCTRRYGGHRVGLA